MMKTYKYATYLLVIIIVISILTSCAEEKKLFIETNYPEVNITEYNNMDKYETIINKGGINYDYTFYFENNECMNALVVVNFKTEKDATDFYNIIENSDEYIDATVSSNVVKYYYNPENFIYMMYSKEMILDLLSEEELIFE